MIKKKFRVYFERHGYIDISDVSTQEEAEKAAIKDVYFGRPFTKENGWVMLNETEEVKEK